LDVLALLAGQPANHTVPKLQLRPFPNASDKALKSGNAQQDHPPFEQPVGALQNQNPRTFVSRPTLRIKPSGQPKPNRRVVRKMGEAATRLDRADMSLKGSGLKIPCKVYVFVESKLGSKTGHNGWRNILSLVWECPGKTNAAQKHRVSEPIVRPPARPDKLQIVRAKREAARKRFRRHIAWKLSETRTLIGREVTGRHDVRNSRHLRRQAGAWKSQDKSFAKHMCETNNFSNMVRTPLGAAA
jgi:hypothetical protein